MRIPCAPDAPSDPVTGYLSTLHLAVLPRRRYVVLQTGFDSTGLLRLRRTIEARKSIQIQAPIRMVRRRALTVLYGTAVSPKKAPAGARDRRPNGGVQYVWFKRDLDAISINITGPGSLSATIVDAANPLSR